MVHFWDPTYRCFKFNEVDMVPTIEDIFAMTLDIRSGYIGSGMSIFGDP
ncbi:hypothetical protein Golax_024172 [Gossypium laxum]|uniref:DUF7745 domain-containing protein n=1 Tax=Gossypium laxum TaxID=34288 RepID=A0A7J8ZB92_9ROSI|nr:hypothetical protein [Gossypium laxum]